MSSPVPTARSALAPGAGGSALATLTYTAAGWWRAMAAGMVLAALCGGVFLTERRG